MACYTTPPPTAPKQLAEKVAKFVTTHGETTAATTRTKLFKKRQIEEPNDDIDEQEYDNKLDERNIPATIHNNNEEEEEEDGDNEYNDNDDNDDDSPRQ